MANDGAMPADDRLDAPAGEPSSTSAPVPALPIDEQGLVAKILLVDDHPANLLAVEAFLEPLGQTIVKASSGEEALRRVLADDFAVILMDVQMPGMDGLQTARLIKQRERSRHVPIIFLTAISKEPPWIFRGYAQGAVDYLLKPFDPDILRSKVSVFVDLWMRREMLHRREQRIRRLERERLQRENESRFRNLTDVMPACVFAARVDGAIHFCNRAWADYSGVPAGDVDDALVLAAFHDDDRARFLAVRAPEDGEPIATEFRLRRRDGEFRWFLVRTAGERDENGEIVRFITAAIDIDDQKRDREALRDANESKDAFLAAASHELRTPLAAAKAQTQLARRRLDRELEPTIGRSLGVIERQIDRMAKLVEDLLDVSRIEANRLSLEVVQVDVGAIARDVLERMQPLSPEHVLSVEVDAGLLVHADRSRVDQVLTNLVTNAVRYSPRGGPIELRAAADGEGVVVSVRDRGVGIPTDKQALIFERFGRAHGAKYGGLGLGLTISLGIVAQHGGRLWVESTGVPGEGSCFFVWLPREGPPRPSTPG